ncbi:MAG: transcriptional regulator NrdR [Patescibacteria group bacterium]
MRCPHCHHEETKVIDSREIEQGKIIRRRRECESCKFRFSTHEELELLNLVVKKRDGHKEPYNRDKIIHGVKLACEKRPVKPEDILKVISQVEQELQNLGKTEVESRIIGNFVIKYLKDFDEVAYLRFASVYKDFKDANGFKKEIEKMKK